MVPRRVNLLVLLLSVFIATTIASNAITLQVEPQTEECFYVNNPPNTQDSYSITFTVIRGGKLDVYLQVTDPNKEVLHRELYFFDASKEDFLGTYTFDARHAGVYSICFDNKMSRYTAKVVSFSVVSNNEQLSSDSGIASHANNLAKKGDLDPIEWALSRINNGLLKVEQEQAHFRIREQNHRDLADRTSSRVLWFATLEIIVLCALSAAQIFYLRRWFNKRSERIS